MIHVSPENKKFIRRMGRQTLYKIYMRKWAHVIPIAHTIASLRDQATAVASIAFFMDMLGKARVHNAGGLICLDDVYDIWIYTAAEINLAQYFQFYFPALSSTSPA
jgi:hypothetical protein